MIIGKPTLYRILLPHINAVKFGEKMTKKEIEGEK